MRVLIADTFEESGRAALESLGCQVDYRPELKDAELAAAIATTDAGVLVVRSTKVTGEMLAAGKPQACGARRSRLQHHRRQSCIDPWDLRLQLSWQKCDRRRRARFGLILALDRRLCDNVSDLKLGRWNKKEYSQARGLYGRTLGLIGLGRSLRR
jgi:D-3-phosphoglycerate dehydrogenase